MIISFFGLMQIYALIALCKHVFNFYFVLALLSGFVNKVIICYELLEHLFGVLVLLFMWF